MGMLDSLLGNASEVEPAKIWISGTSTPIQKKFNKKLNIYQLQSVLAQYVLR
jgi:hypothetical protein